MALQCTDAEWKILEVLWARAPQTMAEITRALAPSTGWSRHVVITLLKRMEEKGTVSVDDTGAAKRYTPLVSQKEASAEETGRFLSHVFRGDATLLLSQLVDSGRLTADDLQQLLRGIDAAKGHGGH